jgi:tRNA threonylcarbamoyladenosine biosynthesis protein TsaB
MIVLALDTAGVDCSVAVYDTMQNRVLCLQSETIGKGHAERLIGMIRDALDGARLKQSDIGLIGVTVGPGSFTGIRVGVAAARGLALALGIPAVGVPTLEVLADMACKDGDEGPIVAAMDAKRGDVYVQMFSADGKPLSEPSSQEIAAATRLVTDNSARVTGSGTALIDASRAASVDHFDMASLARIAATRAHGTGKPAPLYLRGPDAKPQTGYAIERSA